MSIESLEAANEGQQLTISMWINVKFRYDKPRRYDMDTLAQEACVAVGRERKLFENAIVRAATDLLEGDNPHRH